MAPSVRKSSVDACPDLETLAGYLDGRLTERDRAEIAAHVAQCETCYFVFTEAARMRASDVARAATLDNTTTAPGSGWWWTAPKVVWSSAAALALAASLIVAVAVDFVPWRSDEASALRALVVAVGTDRLIEPRLTGGFAYGPVRGAVRGADSESISPDVRIATAEVEKRLAGKRSAEALNRVGVSYLIVGNLPRAISALEDASDSGASAGILSDLSAAYLVRAARDGQPQDAAKALAAAERAIGLDPVLPEARFNRAAALEKLALRDAAIAAWQDYLRVDGSSGWADEARRHLKQLAPERF
jgi:Putative zinc-finger